MKTLAIMCIVALSCIMVTSARSVDDEELSSLLKRLLNNVDDKRHICDNKNCGTGKCGGGEDPNEWGEDYYCYKCGQKGAKNGGLNCEISDPCGEDSGSNPCTTADTPKCIAYSFKPKGYYCSVQYGRSFMDEFLDHLENDADQQQFHEIRMLMAQSSNAEEGLVKYVRSMFN